VDEGGFVVAGVGAGEEAVEGLVVEKLPGNLFGTGIDGEEEGVVGFGGFEIAGGIADHQDFFGGIFAGGGEFKVLGFRAHFLAGDDGDVFGDVVFRPFAFERRGGRLGDDHGVGFAANLLQTFADEREGGDTVNDILDGGVDGVGPDLDLGERGISVFDFGGEGGIAEFSFAGDPFVERFGVGNRNLSGDDFGPGTEQIKGAGEGGETIGAAGLGVEIDEVPGFAGVFADGLEAEMFYEHGRKTFLVLDFHAVENAAVGVDADEELASGFEIAKDLGGISHSYFTYNSGWLLIRISLRSALTPALSPRRGRNIVRRG
jgi:hypothetical protein